MENEDPFLEDMVQSLTKVEGIKPKVAKFCPGVTRLQTTMCWKPLKT